LEHPQHNSLLFVLVNKQDGIRLTIESFSHLAKDSSFGRFLNFEDQSKAEKLLGSGEGWDFFCYVKVKLGCAVILVVHYIAVGSCLSQHNL
jgi:sterol-4alpha-carboxylate 3-dehydrogenase (decarboxylating)